MKKLWDDYTLQDGRTIQVGQQNFVDGTVAVTFKDGDSFDAPMFQDEDGDIGFTVGSEAIYFTHLKHGIAPSVD